MVCLPWEREGKSLTDDELLEAGRNIMRSEAAEIVRAAGRAGAEFVRAARIIHGLRGRLVVSGMGKSGIIARKIAATLASLGTPSFFLHAAEGVHGDLGMVCRDDAALILSNSGNTAEVLSILPHFRRLGAPIIAVTGGLDSPLAANADVVLDSNVPRPEGRRGSPGLAPLQHHPAVGHRRRPGRNGHRVRPVRRGLRPVPPRRNPGPEAHQSKGPDGLRRTAPLVETDVKVSDALFVMMGKGFGAVIVTDGAQAGGHLHRRRPKAVDCPQGVECLKDKVGEAVADPVTIAPTGLRAEAVRVMEEREISAVIVTDGDPWASFTCTSC